MSSLERFFSPSVRFLDKNLKSLPGSRLYFFKAGSSTLKATFADKVGDTANSNPVVADSNGIFPPIFLSGLYRVELRSKDNIVQPGWPIDNVGQDSLVVPFAPWSEIVTYNEDDVVTSADGNWYRSIVNDNLGNDPDDGGAQWEVIVIPIASNFTSDVSWATWSGAGTTISLDIDENGLSDGIGLRTLIDNTDDLHALPALDSAGRVTRYYWDNGSQPANVPVAGAGYAERHWTSASVESLSVRMQASNDEYHAAKNTTWGSWDKVTLQSGLDTKATYIKQRITAGGDFTGDVTLAKSGDTVTLTSAGSLSHASSATPSSAAGVVPAAYRPSDNVLNAYSIRTGVDIRTVRVTSAGTIECEYMDFSGVATSSGGTGGPISITYNISGDIA